VRGFGRGAASWIGLPEDRHTLGQGVLVAVLDTAIEPVWWLGREQIERVDLVGDGAANGHGAAVASIVGGRGEWLGMAPGAELLAVAVMDADGRGDTFSVARGIVTAADRGARIINLCLGSRGDSDVLREAVAYARARGAVLVAAVGNEAAGAVLYPAAYEGVVGVTAIEGHGTVAGFANRGAGVDLAAPGVGMSVGPGEGGGDVAMSGTSAAAPVVSGLLAALLSENPGLSGDDAVAVLRAYADEAGLPGEDAEYGSGIVNMTRVEERNEPDVVDVAVVRPYVRTHPLYADELLVTLMAQNQGTVPIDRVELQVDRNGARQDLVFRGVRPGQTVSHELRIPVRAIPADGLRLDVRAVADGGADARATNDRVSAVLHVPAGSG
jgi:subtilisin family serine protease